ncbi:MAG: DUF4358 domain-containing protein [Ruminococcaceae bacterium]|nr:DUF4358 domain-containing protein [Oscillospiraceae bacterium]
MLLIVLVLSTSCVVGCASQTRASAYDVLSAMIAAAPSAIPAGDVYVLSNDVASGTLMPTNASDSPLWRVADNSLLSAAFGREGEVKNSKISELSQEIVDSGAMFFSTASQPCELMVFRCISRSDTDLVAELLLHRLDTLRRQYRDTEQQSIVENARIVVLGKYVILAVASNVEDAIEAAKSIAK